MRGPRAAHVQRAGLVVGMGLLGGLALISSDGVGAAPDPRLLVTAGDVRSDAAVVWAGLAVPGPVTVDVGPAGAGARQRLTGQATVETGSTVKLSVAGLAPATLYEYRATARGEEVTGVFTTAPAPETAAPVRLVWSGDLGGGGRCRSSVDGYPIFRAMAARRPDFFLFVGDTIYADLRCPVPENVPGADFHARDLAGFRAKHRYNRADPQVQAFLRTTSVYAIWDDHEVTNDFAGPSEPLMPAGRQAFLEYWPILPPPEDPTRLYRRARWGRLVELFILDTRQYRSPNAMRDGPGKTMLGQAQREWLLAGLAESEATWKLVVSSVSLSIPTGAAARDSWARGHVSFPGSGPPTGFDHELDGIVGELAARRLRNVVVLTADVHRAEVIRHAPRPGLVFHELVAGPLSAGHGRPGFLDPALRPTRLFAEGGYDNFGELSVGERGLAVRIIDLGGRTRFETMLSPEP